MASRHSRRLQGLGPEHLAYEDRCFICLLDLEVQSLKRCQATCPVAGNSCTNVVLPKPAKTVTNADTVAATTWPDSDDTLSLDSTEALRADESLPESEDDDDPIWQMAARTTRSHPNRTRSKCHRPLETQCQGPQCITHPTRRHGDVYPITLTSPPGSCSGSIWIGSFPPIRRTTQAHCTSTGLCTHPFQPCPVSGKPSIRNCSTDLIPSWSQRLPLICPVQATLLPHCKTYPDIKISPTPTIVTKWGSFINAWLVSGHHPFIHKICCTPPWSLLSPIHHQQKNSWNT